MKYSIEFTQSASKQLKDLDSRYHSALSKALDKLQENPQLGKPLVGSLKGFWRLRFSRYRIVYQIQDDKLIILVIAILHRPDVYKDL